MNDFPDKFEVDDVRILEALNSPVRLRILYRMMEPITVKEIAEDFGVPVTRLYYHVNLLEELGVIRVVQTRKSGAMTQKIYQASAKSFSAGPGLLDEVDDKQKLAELAVAAVLDGARLDAEAGLVKHFEGLEAGEEKAPGALGRTVIRLDEEGARRLVKSLEEILTESHDLEVDEGEEYALSLVFFPQTGPFGSEHSL